MCVRACVCVCVDGGMDGWLARELEESVSDDAGECTRVGVRAVGQ